MELAANVSARMKIFYIDFSSFYAKRDSLKDHLLASV